MNPKSVFCFPSLKTILILLFAGAIFGPVLDGLHTFSGTEYYTHPVFLKSAWWTPLIFSAAAILIGGSRLVWNRQKPIEPSVQMTVLSFALFISLYFFSAFFSAEPLRKLVMMSFGALISWLALDRTSGGLIHALGTAVVASSVEATLVHLGLFAYTAPDFIGIPIWLPALYIAAAVAVGRLTILHLNQTKDS